MMDTPFTASILSPTMPHAIHPESNAEVLPTNRKKAVIFQNMFLIAQFCYNCLSKWLLNEGLSLMAIQFYERTVSFLLTALVVVIFRVDLHVPKKDRPYVLGRCFVGITGSYSYLLAVKFLPISISMILFFTGPFWATIMGYFFLGEMITKQELIAMIVAFAGVVVIATTPQAEIESPDTADYLEEGQMSAQTKYLLGVTFAIFGALTFAAQSVIVRKMAALNAFTITFWYTMCCSATLLTASLIESCVQKVRWQVITMTWQ